MWVSVICACPKAAAALHSTLSTLLSAYSSAASGALSQLFLKVVAVALRQLLDGSAFTSPSSANPWLHPPVYVALAGLLAFAPLQLVLLDKLLGAASVTFAVPLYQSALIILTTAAGGLFFLEFSAMRLRAALLFSGGVFACMVGVCILSRASSIREEGGGLSGGAEDVLEPGSNKGERHNQPSLSPGSVQSCGRLSPSARHPQPNEPHAAPEAGNQEALLRSIGACGAAEALRASGGSCGGDRYYEGYEGEECEAGARPARRVSRLSAFAMAGGGGLGLAVLEARSRSSSFQGGSRSAAGRQRSESDRPFRRRVASCSGVTAGMRGSSGMGVEPLHAPQYDALDAIEERSSRDTSRDTSAHSVEPGTLERGDRLTEAPATRRAPRHSLP